MPVSYSARRIVCISAIAAAIFSTTNVWAEKSPNDVYLFKGAPDGSFPLGQLATDKTGNLFGTTYDGGTGTDCDDGFSGCGTIFRVTPDGKEKVLHSFAGGCDGMRPWAGLVADGAGNYYGTTTGGGCNGGGTVFKVSRSGKETILHAFQGGSDGAIPLGDVVLDNQGNLYGTTTAGGHLGGDCPQSQGCGVVFEITSDGTEKILYAFTGGDDGFESLSGLVHDTQGNLYGTTVFGGGASACEDGCGTVFKLAPDGTQTVLYAFQGGSDGRGPVGDLILDQAGNLYGTTAAGGATGNGVVFRLAPDGIETVLYSFKGGSDGSLPRSGIMMDQKGNIYGTTEYGGNTGCQQKFGCGTVFKLTPKGKESILLTFDKKNGGNPYAGLLLGGDGMLYGTTSRGGKANGVVFQVKK